MASVYRIEFSSGKSYIGLTMGSVQRRFSEHQWLAARGSEHGVHRALRRYTAEVSVLFETDDPDLLGLIERAAIAFFKPWGLYNMTLGGEGGEPTEETRAKLSAKAREQHRRDPTLASRCAKLNTGAAERMRQMNLARWQDPEYRARMREKQGKLISAGLRAMRERRDGFGQ